MYPITNLKILGRTMEADPLFPHPLFFKRCLDLSQTADGVYAEFGVFRGARFVEITKFARQLGRTSYAFDSFRGMAKPTEKDGTLGANQYPVGRFDVDGPADLNRKLAIEGYTEKDYRIVEGYIPDTLKIPEIMDLRFAFAYVDMDHYYPTKCVLEFLLPRVSRNSIILCDDDFGQHYLSSLAYREFLEEHKDELYVGVREGRQFFWKRH